MRVAWLIVLVPLLAGCLDDDAPATGPAPLGAIALDALEAEAAYAFDFAGGDMRLWADGPTVLTLYGPDDRRLGTMDLGSPGRGVTYERAPAGQYVLITGAVNGTLHVEGSQPVTWMQPLSSHYERVLLVSVPVQDDPLAGLAFPGRDFGQAVHVNDVITLDRTPLLLRLRAAGRGEAVDVAVQGPGGTALAYKENGYVARQGDDLWLEDLGAVFHADRVRGPTFEVNIDAQRLEGVLVLEAYSYSRHVPVAVGATITPDAPAFTYGQLPDVPVAVEVHPDASHLAFWAPTQGHNDTLTSHGDAWVAVFGPDDQRIGAFDVPADGVIAVPVQMPGQYVLVGHGDIQAGADAVPVDFEMHVLDVRSDVAPDGPAGQDQAYAIRQGNATTAGVPFSVIPLEDVTSPQEVQDFLVTPLIGCDDPGTMRVLVGGETIGYWGYGLQDHVDAIDRRLGNGPIHFVQDGFGGRCGHAAMRILSYVR